MKHISRPILAGCLLMSLQTHLLYGMVLSKAITALCGLLLNAVVTQPIVRPIQKDWLEFSTGEPSEELFAAFHLFLWAWAAKSIGSAVCAYAIRKATNIKTIKKRWATSTPLSRLSIYVGPKDDILRDMALHMRLNPHEIFIEHRFDNDSFDPALAVLQVYDILSLNIPTEQEDDFESTLPLDEDMWRFAIGHELAHIKRHDVEDRIKMSLWVPLMAHISLVLGNLIIQKGFYALCNTLNCANNPIIATMGLISHCASQSLLLKACISHFLVLKRSRAQEKLADITSARCFNCAQDGIRFFKQSEMLIQALQEQPSIRMYDKLIEFLSDEHPSPACRIAYLRPLAAAQTFI